MDDRGLCAADALRPAGHDLRRPRRELRQGRLRLVLRLRAVAQSRLRRGVGGRGALPALFALGIERRADRESHRVLQPDLRPRRHGARRQHPVHRAGRRAVRRRVGAALGDVYGCRGALGHRHRLHRARRIQEADHAVRPPVRAAGVADGAGAGGPRRGRRRGDRGDLLRAAAARAAADLSALPRRLSRFLLGRAAGDHSRRARRVRWRHADRARPLSGRAAHRRRDPDLPALLLRDPAVPRRQPVRRQRVLRPRAHAGARRRDRADRAHQRRRFRRRRRRRRGGAVRLPAALAGRDRAAAGLLLDRTPTSPRSRRRPASSCRR